MAYLGILSLNCSGNFILRFQESDGGLLVHHLGLPLRHWRLLRTLPRPLAVDGLGETEERNAGKGDSPIAPVGIEYKIIISLFLVT